MAKYFLEKIIEDQLRYTTLRNKGEITVRKASEVEYGFPYGSKLVCYIEHTKDKDIIWIQNYAQEKRDVYYRVKNESSRLYAVWPDQYCSDMFEIDDIELYGKEYIK